MKKKNSARALVFVALPLLLFSLGCSESNSEGQDSREASPQDWKSVEYTVLEHDDEGHENARIFITRAFGGDSRPVVGLAFFQTAEGKAGGGLACNTNIRNDDSYTCEVRGESYAEVLTVGIMDGAFCRSQSSKSVDPTHCGGSDHCICFEIDHCELDATGEDGHRKCKNDGDEFSPAAALDPPGNGSGTAGGNDRLY